MVIFSLDPILPASSKMYTCCPIPLDRIGDIQWRWTYGYVEYKCKR